MVPVAILIRVGILAICLLRERRLLRELVGIVGWHIGHTIHVVRCGREAHLGLHWWLLLLGVNLLVWSACHVSCCCFDESSYCLVYYVARR